MFLIPLNASFLPMVSSTSANPISYYLLAKGIQNNEYHTSIGGFMPLRLLARW
jgi:hypothetical protein